MKKLILILLLFGCKKSEVLLPNQEPKDVIGTTSTNVINQDALGGIVFENVNKYNNKSYGSLIVNKSNGYPVYDGNESVRFEVRNGDCGWNDQFSDCATDRSRSELFESLPQTEYGKVISYTERIYIPNQTNFKPTGNNNLLVLTQVNFSDTLNTFGALTYLVMGNNNTLLIRTHKEFSWIGLNDYVITTTPFDKWITIRYDIKVSKDNDGEIKVYINDKLLFIENRPTVITKSGKVLMKFGIYNSFRGGLNYSTQVVYFDGLKKNNND